MSAHSKTAKQKTRKRGLSRVEKIAIVIIIIAVAWVAYSFSVPPPSNNTTQTNLAPDFTLPVVGQNGLTGQSVSLSSFRGKVVLLEFMVPWCVHCQNMVPELEKLYEQYGAQNVVFLSVSGSWQGATAADAAKFIRTYGSQWTYVYDSSGSVFNTYGVSGTPTFFIIGKDGKVAATYSGEVAPATLGDAISKANV